MEHRLYSKQKGAPRHAVPCGHKSATVDGIKLSITNMRGYIVIAPLACLLACLLALEWHNFSYLSSSLSKKYTVIIAEICYSRKGERFVDL